MISQKLQMKIYLIYFNKIIMKVKCVQVGVGWWDKILKLFGKKKFKKGIFIIKK